MKFNRNSEYSKYDISYNNGNNSPQRRKERKGIIFVTL